MNVAIIEDKAEDCRTLVSLLTQFNKDHGLQIKIDTYPTGEIFLACGIEKKYHVLFMDIYLADIDGIETLSRLHKVRDDALVIFLTSSDEDIWRAVKTHGCFDYILKQELTYSRLEKVVIDVIDKLDMREKTVEFESGKQKVILKIQDIQYVTARDKYIMIVFKNNIEHRYRFPFSQFYELVENEPCFLLCNRGVLLNMNYIQQSNGMVFIMKDDIQFPIRRKDRKRIIRIFDEYQFERLNKWEMFV